jgi:23S rRNA pseudouridine2605 synthase
MKKPLQKFIADSGYCSRRKAESLIIEGKVKVNKEVFRMGTKVDEKDQVTIKNRTIKPQKKSIYILLNKPKGYVCTNNENEKNVFSLVDIKERLFVVGRLDKNSWGLVLLTNDGDLTYKLTHPSFEHEKEYIVESSREISPENMERMKKGVDLKEKTKAKMKSIKRIGKNKYQIVLSEGKKRQIRRTFEVFDSTVLDLKRIRIDKYKLGNLKKGQWIHTEKL